VVGHSDVDVHRSERIGVEPRHSGHEDHPRTPLNCVKI
jgi:hypothetical protein